MVAATAASGHPADAQSLESQVKAAYIYNFLSYAEWPASAFASAADPLRVCAVSDTAFESMLERTVRGETVNGRRLLMERTVPGESLTRCHVLFVAGDRAAETVVQSIDDAPVLTVGESDRFARAGGIVNFVIDAGRVRFDVNQTAAQQRGLRLSSRLLRLARRVS